MLNISVSGNSAAISSLIVEKHGKTEGTIKGSRRQTAGVNDGADHVVMQQIRQAAISTAQKFRSLLFKAMAA